MQWTYIPVFFKSLLRHQERTLKIRIKSDREKQAIPRVEEIGASDFPKYLQGRFSLKRFIQGSKTNSDDALK